MNYPITAPARARQSPGFKTAQHSGAKKNLDTKGQARRGETRQRQEATRAINIDSLLENGPEPQNEKWVSRWSGSWCQGRPGNSSGLKANGGGAGRS